MSPLEGSPLALSELRLPPEAARTITDTECDCLVYVFEGSGVLTLDTDLRPLSEGTAALLLAGEQAELAGGGDGLAAVCATVRPDADRHAPLGPREIVVQLDDAGAERATGARSFQILFGPHNGSTRATLFAGFIPPGKAPWHYHLYDEIVWVPVGPGRLHLGGTTEELGSGSAFRLQPRQVHIVENLAVETEMTVIGIFTPAGSPSAAYVTPDIAAEYIFAG